MSFIVYAGIWIYQMPEASRSGKRLAPHLNMIRAMEGVGAQLGAEILVALASRRRFCVAKQIQKSPAGRRRYQTRAIQERLHES